MTRKDFQLIAETICDLQLDKKTHESIVAAFSKTLKRTNYRFDEMRFRNEAQHEFYYDWAEYQQVEFDF